MYIKRNLEDKIIKYLETPEIVAVVGPRQCGKTTMLKKIMSSLADAVSVSFDDQNILGLFEKSPDDFITAYVKDRKYLFIDEFQYAKHGGKILKYIFDTQKIKIIISGSSVADLTIHAIKYLVGRVLVVNLYPFDFREFLSYKDIAYLKIYDEYKNKFSLSEEKPLEIGSAAREKLLRYYEEYLTFGGYPRVALEENIETKKELLKNIYNTYFLREVRDILGLIDDYKLGVFIKGLALQTGNLIEYNELANLTGYSYSSVKKYLNFLEKTYICKLIRPYFKNKRTEIVKNPKVYFIDTGIRNTVINDFRGLGDRVDKGSLLENGLAMQFIKQGFDFNFWRDKKKNEIDFVLSLGNGKLTAIESKNSLKDQDLKIREKFKKNYPEANIIFSCWRIDKIGTEPGCYPIYLF
ncbi:ATP-binding protein [Candidatus Parcubacteria bacterium]|nr:MAG: ATP-binding protein [Candidatus Parcubacteria bacterium]